MRITLGELKRLVKHALQEKGTPPYLRNVMSPESDDRPAIERQSANDIDNDELSSHLRDAMSEPDDQGPVGRRSRKDDLVFAPSSDPYASDWNVIGNRRFGNR